MISFKTQLYDHQRAAVEKLSKVKVGALYMEQGTGKTRTALELIKLRYDAGKIDTVIWLCPCSVKENLRRDIIIHCGIMPDNITICGIETLSTSVKWMKKLMGIVNDKVYFIVDESTLIKNFRARRTMNITKLSGYCKYKLILNGTPVTKNESDLFAQWYLLDPRILGYQSFYSFAANHLEYDEYGKVRRCLNVDYLAAKIAPFTYQVKKSECLDLPYKTYSTCYFSLPDFQSEEYERVKDMFFDAIDEFNEATIYRALTALQLVLSGRRIISKLHEHIKSEPMYSTPVENPRIIALMNILSGITEKCIIFCKYSQEIKDICSILGEAAVPFDGSLSLKKRQMNLDAFREGVQFLVANKTCAGYGLNLQFCHYVVYYENDFDYATRAQSEDRVHRIGQEKNVHYIDICASNKLDERIIACLSRKENLVEHFRREIHKRREFKGGIENASNRIILKGKAKNRI